MALTSHQSSHEPYGETLNDENTQTPVSHMPRIPRRPLMDQLETIQTPSMDAMSLVLSRPRNVDIPAVLSYIKHVSSLDTEILPVPTEHDDATLPTLPVPSLPNNHNSVPPPMLTTNATSVAASNSRSFTLPKYPTAPDSHTKVTRLLTPQSALLFIMLLGVVVFHAINAGSNQFMGPQGWAYALGGNANQSNLLSSINQSLQSPSGSANAQHTQRLTPQQYIDTIVQKMTLDQELGQMMLVEYTGPDYSLDLSTMISQYNVGAVLIFAANQNIQSKTQLTGVVQQMQHNSQLPLAISIDQEGGNVDRLVSLDGPRPGASTIGATNNPQVALQQGVQDAQDLASYGINLNLAPVVDVTNVYNPQLYGRTFGDTAALVTSMAGAYLKGLQQSGKVLGTLKHFPGLGDVGVDPHSGVPYLYRSKTQLEQIDWAPYRTLIAQGNVHAVMVTHEIVQAVDSTKPSSLSYNVVTGILRNELGFNGVIITDSLTMEGITAYYDQAQAAALAVEAGDDLLMGASTPSDVATMIQGIKQAMTSGQISQQRIDDSVRRILMLKYDMGLLPLPK